MTAALVPTGFADDPVASHSAMFPLAGTGSASGVDSPSPDGVRPWGLRTMTAPRRSPDRPSADYLYDPISQTAVDMRGAPLVDGPSAESVSNSDGDEGPSEDWRYDHSEDNPWETV